MGMQGMKRRRSGTWYGHDTAAVGCIRGDNMGGTGSDEGQFYGQVDTLKFPTFDARQRLGEVMDRDGNTSIMELEATNEGSEDRLVLEQSELHPNTDPGTFREGE